MANCLFLFLDFCLQWILMIKSINSEGLMEILIGSKVTG